MKIQTAKAISSSMKANNTSHHPFQLLDEILARQTITTLSLNPKQDTTTSFRELGVIVNKTDDLELIKTLASSLEFILHSSLHNFPENIFWDFDFLVNSMLKQALQVEDYASFLETFSQKTVLLMETFGIKSEIRFRYIHDFIYGFDWAKWVQQDPENRANTEPFSLCFLDYLLNRGEEILHCISVNDRVYHPISQETYRNPFCFSREPEDEHRLLTGLVAEQLIPVATWDWNACPVWNKPFHKLREQVSFKLNISQKC